MDFYSFDGATVQFCWSLVSSYITFFWWFWNHIAFVFANHNIFFFGIKTINQVYLKSGNQENFPLFVTKLINIEMKVLVKSYCHWKRRTFLVYEIFLLLTNVFLPQKYYVSWNTSFSYHIYEKVLMTTALIKKGATSENSLKTKWMNS